MTIERVRAVIDAATPPEGLGRIYVEGDPTSATSLVLAHNLMPELLGLWETAREMVLDAEPDQNYEGEFIEYLASAESVDALRAALDALDAKAKEVLG